MGSIYQILVVLILGLPTYSKASYRLENGNSLRELVNINEEQLRSESFISSIKGLKVAILDNGFGSIGADPAKVKEFLPERTEVVEIYPSELLTSFGEKDTSSKPERFSSSDHGLRLAQIVWEMTGRSNEDAPYFYLLNANGFTNFKKAVFYCIQNKVDVILYAQNFSFGGNFDGKGFINQIVDKATESGIIWVNAMGNNRSLIYTASLNKNSLDDENYVILEADKVSLYFTNKMDDNPITISLAWTDSGNFSQINPDKDLDLELFNGRNELVGRSNYIQIPREEDEKRGRNSQIDFAHEKIKMTLPKGRYHMKLYFAGGKIQWRDEIKLLITTTKPNSLKIHTSKMDMSEVLIPGDNKSVITVSNSGNYASRSSATWDLRIKPDLILPDIQVQFSDGIVTQGTSDTAAIVVGASLVLIARDLAAKKLRSNKKTKGEDRGTEIKNKMGRVQLLDQLRKYSFVATNQQEYQQNQMNQYVQTQDPGEKSNAPQEMSGDFVPIPMKTVVALPPTTPWGRAILFEVPPPVTPTMKR